MKIISPQNKLLLKADKLYYDEIITESGITFYQDTSFNPQEFAMMEFTVHSVPPLIIKRQDYEGFCELPSPGDRVLGRYDIVYAYREQPDRASPIHKNIIRREGQEFWRADIMQIFAVKAGADWRMLNQYVLCDLVEERRTIGEVLILPEHLRTEIRRDKMRIRNIEHPELRPGDIIYTTPNAAQQYKIGKDEFYIIRQRHIQAVAI